MVTALGDSQLFSPLTISNGSITLSHRLVLAPLTRSRCVPLKEDPTDQQTHLYVPDALVANYYAQRTTPGGLLISEGIHPNLEGGGIPGVSGLFTSAHVDAWKQVTSAVHEKGGYIYAQLWHAGRTTLPAFTGMPSVSSSAVTWESEDLDMRSGLRKKDYPPREMTVDDIKRTCEEYANAAENAIRAGFDGVEVHGANGYLPEQFLNDNINRRTDLYGGSPENRSRFILELLEKIIAKIGEDRTALRLSPFSLYNNTRGSQRMDTWGFLCREIKRRWSLSYIHFIEPRFEQIEALMEEKATFLASIGLSNITLQPFRDIMRNTPLITAGGYSHKNSLGIVESGSCDAIAYGRWFLSTPDFVERMRNGLPMNPYDRSRFYGPFPDDCSRAKGYTDYPTSAENTTSATS